jgi:glycosyltransferase involved in cell wall biosynthesis
MSSPSITPAPAPEILPLPTLENAAQSEHTNGASATATAPKTIHALHLVNGEHYSGAERVQDLLAGRLPNLGCEVAFVCVKPRRFPAARESQHAPLFEIPMRGRFDLRVVRRIARLVEHEGYHLIHAHTPRTALVGSLAARRAGVPFIYHVHSPVGRDSTHRLANWLNAAVESLAVRHAAHLIAVSPTLRDYMIARGTPPERITYIPNGVPAPKGILSPREDLTSRRERLWTLGAIALFRPRKGIEVLLEALAALRSRGHNIRLRAVGGFETPAYEAAILALAQRLNLTDAIDWIGFTRSINRELAKIDVLVLPSLFGEGLPMVVLEAMAAGIPVVASHVEGVPEAVIHRQTGLLVEPGSVSQLARAIEDSTGAGIDYPTLSQAARERHATHFSDTQMADSVAILYREVLRGAGVILA